MPENVIRFRIPDDWAEALKQELEKEETTVTGYLRPYLEKKLKRAGHQLSPPPKVGGFRPGAGRKKDGKD